jgi:PKD repeat protein
VQDGFISAGITAGDRPARAVIKAAAVPPGTAQGETVVYFGDGRPVADAGEDQTVHSGQQVVLDGSGSWDQQDRPLTYAWRQIAGSAATLVGVDTVAPTFAAPAVTDREVLTFELIVSVDGEQSTADQTLVTVLGQEAGLPSPVIVLDPDNGPAPLQVLLDGSNSAAEEPAILTNFLWTFSDGEPAVWGETASRTFTEPGGFGVQLTVTDDRGRFNFAQKQVSVSEAENQPPRLSVTALPERGEVPLEVVFTAQAVDPGDQLTAIEWDFGAGFALQGEQQTKTYHNPGFHKVRARVQDDAGLYSTAELTIAASDQGVYPPRILSSPLSQAEAGQGYTYQPVAAGSPTFSWSLGKQVGDQLTRAPEGMQVDGVSGLITWTPRNKQAGAVDVTLVVQNDAGSDFQDFTIMVEGGSGEPSCGCDAFYRPGSSQGGGLNSTNLLLVLLILAGLRRAGGPREPVRRPHPPAGPSPRRS